VSREVCTRDLAAYNPLLEVSEMQEEVLNEESEKGRTHALDSLFANPD
jgi:hypothetical protein